MSVYSQVAAAVLLLRYHSVAFATIGLVMTGCAPNYQTPKRVDYFRAEPSPQEALSATGPEQFLPLQVTPPPAPDPALTTDLAAPADLPLSLEEAIRIGLSNSGVVRVLSGGSVSAADATAYDADAAEARARAALAAFDPNISTGLYSNWINQPPEAVFGPGLAEPTRRDEAGLTAALSKPWLTGGETRVGYNPPLGYLYLPMGTSGFNPLYESNLEFSLRQPLLKGAGFGVNKAPIRVAQLRRDQVVLQTQQAAMASVRSISEAYWDLYSATVAWKAVEDVVPLLDRVVYIEQERMNAQRSVRADVAKVKSQLHAVMQQAVQARSIVVQRELTLRNLLGLPPSDGNRIRPVSQPLEAPVTIDVESSTATAMELRPDLIRQRLNVRTREQELVAAKNAGLPQLDAVGLYRWNGVGERLDDSIDQMFGTQYADFQTSLTLSMPLGRRAAAAGIRAATLQLAREKAMLQQSTHSTTHIINALAREAEYTYQLYKEADARLQANGDWLEGARIRYENPPPSGDDWLLAATNDYLTALRSQADAASDKQVFLARYNAVLARLHETMGTILSDYDVVWSCAPQLQSTTAVTSDVSWSSLAIPSRTESPSTAGEPTQPVAPPVQSPGWPLRPAIPPAEAQQAPQRPDQLQLGPAPTPVMLPEAIPPGGAATTPSYYQPYRQLPMSTLQPSGQSVPYAPPLETIRPAAESTLGPSML